MLLEGLDRLSVAPGARVVLGYSGGADSLGLLALLALLPRRRRLEVEAVHIDHAIRPESADDAKRAARAAGALEIPFSVIRLSPAQLMPEGSGLEAIARRGRYRALAEAAAGRPIFTAHTADDQAETILYRLAKGTGTRGLVGIRPSVRLEGGLILRPALELERQQLRGVVETMGLDVVEDPSNQSRAFVRNRLRLDVLPALEEAIPGATGRIARAARLARLDERYLSSRARRAAATLERGGGLDAAKLLKLPEALRFRIIRDRIEAMEVSPPSAAAIARILSILREGGEIHLAKGILAEVAGGILRIAPGETGRRRGTESRSRASKEGKEREE